LYFRPSAPTSHIYSLSLHDALPISQPLQGSNKQLRPLEPFAEWVCTDFVHTYIAKRPSSPIYRVTDPRIGGQAQAGQELQFPDRSEEHTSELQSRFDLVCRLLLEKK